MIPFFQDLLKLTSTFLEQEIFQARCLRYFGNNISVELVLC